MTQEQFIPSVEEPSDGMTPLRKFRGTLKEHRPVSREVNGRTRMSVAFDFVDVTVIESTEPYPFPIATITIPYSDRGQTRWAAFTQSFRNLIPKPEWSEYTDPLSLLDGKQLEMTFDSAKLRLPVRDEEGNDTGNWATQDGEAWKLTWVEGYGSGGSEGGDNSIMGKILEYADGKTDQEIYQWVYTNQELKNLPGYAQVVEQIAERKLLTMYLEAGTLTQDADGKYHKVAG